MITKTANWEDPAQLRRGGPSSIELELPTAGIWSEGTLADMVRVVLNKPENERQHLTIETPGTTRTLEFIDIRQLASQRGYPFL